MLALVPATAGLTIGIPRFKPRRINKQAITMVKTGTILVILPRHCKVMYCPAKETASISGKVPRPNKAIYAIPVRLALVATAPAKAIYTSPQGNKPLSMPLKK